MSTTERIERPRYVKKVAAPDLTPGLILQYSVWGERGQHGDFDGQFSFKRWATWAVSAEIIDEEEIALKRQTLLGHRAVFNVFENIRSKESIQESSGVILPRETHRTMTVAELGKYPVQQGYATRIEDYSIDGQATSSGRLRIPARNIKPGSLRIVGAE